MILHVLNSWCLAKGSSRVPQTAAREGSEQHLTQIVSRFIFQQLHDHLFPTSPMGATGEDHRPGLRLGFGVELVEFFRSYFS